MSRLEQQTKKEELWKTIFTKVKDALRENDRNKAGIIRSCCMELENQGMPLEMICGRVMKELGEFASRKYFFDVIDKKYKDSSKVREYHKKENGEGAPVGITDTPKDVEKDVEEESEIKHVDDVEDTIIWQIPVEKYNIDDIEKYDKAFLQKLVVYLHIQVQNLRSAAAAQQ